jgi:hypothetical protein
MTVTFPLTPPTTPKPTRVTWSEINLIGSAVSQFTLIRQVYDWAGGSWRVDVEFDPLERVDAAPWIAFLSSLRGGYGTFYFGSTLCASPLGTGAGSPKVNAASQTGFTLVTDGWTASSAVLKAGDFISIDYCLYRNEKDVSADGSGNATLDIWPALRGHADNATITVTNPVGTFRLAENSNVIQDESRDALYNVSFSAIEAIS